jgi:hypothetical protein
VKALADHLSDALGIDPNYRRLDRGGMVRRTPVARASSNASTALPVTVHAKMLRLELLNVKADLERELETGCRTARSAASTCIG